MLHHHSAQAYNASASAAAAHARGKFEEIITRGRASLASTIAKIETDVPTDFLVPWQKMSFGVQGGRVFLDHPVPNEALPRLAPLHRHALTQVAEKANLGSRFVNARIGDGDWGQELLAYNLCEILSHAKGKSLIRRSGGEVRGVLTDAYKRMDSGPLLQAMLEVAGEYGALPVEGVYLETKTQMKLVLPHIFEPVPNEVLLFGLAWGNSEYGDGKFYIRSFIERLWCTNFATLEDEIERVHLGKRVTDETVWSQETRRLDMATLISATRDVVGRAFSPEAVTRSLDLIAKANEEKVTAIQIGAFLKRARLSTEEVKKAQEIFSSADVEMLPPGQNRWRLSNALSLLAGGLDDGARRLELQVVAGDALRLPMAA